MALMQTAGSGAYALSLSVVIAAIYIAVVRFMDLNEKEPLWAVGLVFLLGALAAAILPLLVSSTVLELRPLAGAVAVELAMFVALALSVIALAAVARSRGWSEIHGLMDGIVYGTATGFGYATGATFVRELTVGGPLGEIAGAGPLATLWTTALTGLSYGLFGAIIGAGFGAAAVARTAALRVAYPVVGLIGAILVHVAYTSLAQGNALGGSAALVRVWIALIIPVIFVVAVVVIALGREKRTIREELAGESEGGVVTPDDLNILPSFAARRSLYARTFLKGDFDGWLAMREMHNRQVQLALTKRQASGESDPERRAEIETEVQSLRASVLELRRTMEARLDASDAGRAGV